MADGDFDQIFYAISQFLGEFTELALILFVPDGLFSPSRHSAESTGPAASQTNFIFGSKFMSCFLRAMPWQLLDQFLGFPSGTAHTGPPAGLPRDMESR